MHAYKTSGALRTIGFWIGSVALAGGVSRSYPQRHTKRNCTHGDLWLRSCQNCAHKNTRTHAHIHTQTRHVALSVPSHPPPRIIHNSLLLMYCFPLRIEIFLDSLGLFCVAAHQGWQEGLPLSARRRTSSRTVSSLTYVTVFSTNLPATHVAAVQIRVFRSFSRFRPKLV